MLSFNPLELFRLRSKNTQVPFSSYKFEEAKDLSAFDKLLPSEEGDHIHVSLPTTSRRERNYRVITAINVVVLLASMLTFGLAYSNSYHLRHNVHNSLLRNVDFFCKSYLQRPSSSKVNTYPSQHRSTVSST